jgi:hypothetical protein
MKWDTLIEEKTSELGRFLIGRSRGVDFSEPPPALERTDSGGVREMIRNLTLSEAGKLGIGRSTFHCLRKKARREKPFRLYHKIRIRAKVEA